MKKPILWAAATVLFLSGCKENEESTECGTAFNFDSGALIVNEGPFQGTGSISHYDLTTNTATNLVYEKANCDIPAGLFLQSLAVNDNKGYVISNGSGEIQVVNLSTFKNEKTIFLSYPRYMTFEGGKGYITNGTTDGKVYVIDETNTLIDSVSVGKGPEAIYSTGTKLIVPNTGVYPDVDSIISIIDLTDLSVTSVVGWSKPSDVVEDVDGNIWVSCKGSNSWDTPGELPPVFVKIDANTNQVLETITVGEPDESISKIAISPGKNIIYYFKSDGVYRLGINGDYVNDPAFISTSGSYGLEVDPKSGDIFVFDAKDYTGSGEVRRYDSAGTLVSSVSVGVSPNGAIFK